LTGTIKGEERTGRLARSQKTAGGEVEDRKTIASKVTSTIANQVCRDTEGKGSYAVIIHLMLPSITSISMYCRCFEKRNCVSEKKTKVGGIRIGKKGN
jgi:hypothetical protein